MFTKKPHLNWKKSDKIFNRFKLSFWVIIFSNPKQACVKALSKSVPLHRRIAVLDTAIYKQLQYNKIDYRVKPDNDIKYNLEII